jgi:hypothetical protein
MKKSYKPNQNQLRFMNPIIKIISGLIGVLLLGGGGYFLFEGLYLLSYNGGVWNGDYIFSGWGFLAFSLIGLGLWLIIISGRAETKPT